MQRLRHILVSLLLATLVVWALPALVGCDQDPPAEETSEDDATAGDDAGEVSTEEYPAGDGQEEPEVVVEELSTFFVYFVEDGLNAFGVEREVEYPIDDWEAALIELMSGPLEGELATWPALSTAIPEGSQVNMTSLDAGVLTVDFNETFSSGGGTFSVTARLAQVVYTLTQFEEVDSVLFSIDGTVVQMFSSEGLMLDGPQTSEDYYQLLPIDA